VDVDPQRWNATSADFQALTEQVAGVQLDDIFDAWVYGTGMPTVTS
jgi:aminopeptidase N